MSKFKEDALLALCFRKKLITSDIKEHFTIFYSSEPAIKVKEQDKIYDFISFLENIASEGGKDVDFLTDQFSKSQCPNPSWLLKRYGLKIFCSISLLVIT